MMQIYPPVILFISGSDVNASWNLEATNHEYKQDCCIKSRRKIKEKSYISNDHLQRLRVQHMNSDTRRFVMHPVVMQHQKSTARMYLRYQHGHTIEWTQRRHIQI